MSDLPDAPRHDDVSAGSDSAPPSMPRWVKLSAIVVGSLLVLFVILQLTGQVQHGPGLHGG